MGKPRSGNPKAYTESGFQGHLTKVQIWSRALDVTAEVQKQVRDCRTEPVLYKGLVLTWAGYEDTAGGVERLVPSSCGQRKCPSGYTGTKCQDLEVDKVIMLDSKMILFLLILFLSLDTTKSRILSGRFMGHSEEWFSNSLLGRAAF